MGMGESRNKNLNDYLIEGVLIVVSILVAFALDAAWSEYQDDKVEREMVMELYDELVESETRIQNSINEIELQMKSGREFLEMVGENVPPDYREKSEVLFFDILTGNTLEVPMSVNNSILSTGQLRLIENEDLRRRISSWPALVEDVLENHEWHRKNTDEQFIPMLAGRLDIRSIFSGFSDLNLPGSPLALSTQSIFTDAHLEGMLVWRFSRQNATLRESVILLEASREMRAIINASYKRPKD
jgi:hypothetical protein